MKYRPPSPPSQNVLAGSDRDLDRLQTLAQETLDQHPAVAPGVHRIRQDLLAETRDARRDYERIATATPLPASYGDWTRFDLFLAAVHMLLFFAVVSTSFVMLPTRNQGAIEAGSLVTWSTNSGYVATAVIVLALLLPPARIKDLTRQLAGFSLLQVTFIAVGLASGSYITDLREGAGEAEWTRCLISNLVVAVMLCALAARGYALARRRPVEGGRKTMERHYTTAIHGAKQRAIERLETLLHEHPNDQQELERKWRKAVKHMVAERRISRPAAANAKISTPWRWQLEATASPRYKAQEDQTLND